MRNTLIYKLFEQNNSLINNININVIVDLPNANLTPVHADRTQLKKRLQRGRGRRRKMLRGSCSSPEPCSASPPASESCADVLAAPDVPPTACRPRDPPALASLPSGASQPPWPSPRELQARLASAAGWRATIAALDPFALNRQFHYKTVYVNLSLSRSRTRSPQFHVHRFGLFDDTDLQYFTGRILRTLFHYVGQYHNDLVFTYLRKDIKDVSVHTLTERLISVCHFESY